MEGLRFRVSGLGFRVPTRTRLKHLAVYSQEELARFLPDVSCQTFGGIWLVGVVADGETPCPA